MTVSPYSSPVWSYPPLSGGGGGAPQYITDKLHNILNLTASQQADRMLLHWKGLLSIWGKVYTEIGEKS